MEKIENFEFKIKRGTKGKLLCSFTYTIVGAARASMFMLTQEKLTPKDYITLYNRIILKITEEIAKENA